MPFYYDREDRQTQQDTAAYRAYTEPRVSAAEAVSGAQSSQAPETQPEPLDPSEHEDFVENAIYELLSLGESWDEISAREEAERQWGEEMAYRDKVLNQAKGKP